MVKTVVQPKPLSSYALDVPALPTVEEVTVSVPVLRLPGLDDLHAAPSSPHLEAGAAGMLQVRMYNFTTERLCLTQLSFFYGRPME